RLDELGLTLVRAGLVVSGTAIMAGILRGESAGNLLLNATNLAVSVIPDGLTPTITATMGLGALRVIRKKAFIRQLPAMDTLGCTSVICCDKTGTLTKNQFEVREIYCARRTWEMPGVNIANISGMPGEDVDDDVKALQCLLQAAALCTNASLKSAVDSEELTAEGDSTDCALLLAAARGGLDIADVQERFSRLEEIPFNSYTMHMTVICQERDGERFSFVKGAPENLVNRCVSIMQNGQIEHFTDGCKKEIIQKVEEMTYRALRVIALAYKPLEDDDHPEERLTFVGLAGMIDPPRAGVNAMVDVFRRAGIRMMMITGDHRNTALAVAREIGMAVDGKDRVITGDEFDQMRDEDLTGVVREVQIFARFSPGNKLRLVSSLKRLGLVVGMIGDGINDAPAIKEANLGIAMGKTGAAVTREVASIILSDDCLALLPEAIREGRTVYVNIRKCMYYLMSTNMGDGILILTALLLGQPLPISTFQLLWINLSSDPVISWALANDPPDPQIMHRPPRQPGESILAKGLGRRIVTRSLMLGLSGLLVYNISRFRGDSQAMTRTSTMATLGLSRFFQLFDCRRDNGCRLSKPGANTWIPAGGAIILATLAGGMYLPFLRVLLKTAPLGIKQWLSIAAWSGLGFLSGTGLDYLWEHRRLPLYPDSTRHALAPQQD
ncbi:MAG: cation-translocating P-type ATPase, partial [Bacillota bacterium]